MTCRSPSLLLVARDRSDGGRRQRLRRPRIAAGRHERRRRARRSRSTSGRGGAADGGAFVLTPGARRVGGRPHEGATLVPLGSLGPPAEVPRDAEVVVVCRSGNRSAQGRDVLLAAGYPAVTSSGGRLPGPGPASPWSPGPEPRARRGWLRISSRRPAGLVGRSACCSVVGAVDG
jgi:rhodanese-related sulfurtransferase